jgi:Ca2+-binding EF-hand superfamily protein
MNMSSMMGVGGGRMPDFSAMREKMFAKADANGDKALSFEEFEGAGKKMPVGNGGDAKAAFAKIDGDGNGSLSQEEMKSFGDKMSSGMQDMMLAMQAMMGGGKGQGMGGMMGGQKPDISAMFGKIDGDGNGSVSRAEFNEGAKDNPIAKLLSGNDEDAFGKIDADGDGALSKDEMKSFAKDMKERMQSMMGGAGESSRADYMQAVNAYTGGSGGKEDLTSTLLKMLDGDRNQAGKQQNSGRDIRA